ncbi:MAG TPA: tellurite resistance TerB family protein [Acidobacteriota bacterium]
MIGHQQALIYTMVLVSASDGEMTDAELNTIGDIIKHLPIFRDYDLDSLGKTAEACAELLADPSGLDTAGDLIEQALPAKLRETAYALACDVAAADANVSQAELELLRWLRGRLGVPRLQAAAIELATRAHYITV